MAYPNPAESVDYGCEICGNHCDDCTCPVCPVCKTQGDPDCVKNHGLIVPEKPTGPGVIANEAELIAFVDATDREGAKRRVRKDTECGAWIVFNPDGIELGSIVEGSDATTGTRTLEYPFTQDDYNDAIQAIEQEADELWNEANLDEFAHEESDERD